MAKSGMSEYELQRQKNLEENRRILESIRQEQQYQFAELIQQTKKTAKPADGQAKPKKKATPRPPADNQGSSDAENESSQTRRKSSRLSGKKPRYSVHGDDGQEDDDKDFEGEEDEEFDSDDEEFEGAKKRRSQPAGPKGPRPKIVIPKDRPNFYGAVPGVPIGKIWETRMACCADGIHRPTVAGIHAGPEGAYSISLSGGYEDDVDLGDCFTYTGEGGRALKGTKANPKNLRTAPQSKDQELTRGNLALSLNVTSRKPVRVIRGYKLNNEFSPEFGYRYDGLYTVEKYWSCTGKAGFKVYKFALRRCADQVPPPWITGPLPVEEPKSGDEEEEDDEDDDKPAKPSVLQVKLFNK